jgi:hypothetical protein
VLLSVHSIVLGLLPAPDLPPEPILPLVLPLLTLAPCGGGCGQHPHSRVEHRTAGHGMEVAL